VENSCDDGSEETVMPVECAQEMTSRERLTHNLLTPSPASSVNLQEVISCEKYSTLSRLPHVTAYVLRYVRTLTNRIKSIQIAPLAKTLGPEEVSEAERLWIIESQRQFGQDRHFDEWKKQFGLFNDEKGIWRCGGRLSNDETQYDTKHPVFLSKRHHLALLIVR